MKTINFKNNSIAGVGFFNQTRINVVDLREHPKTYAEAFEPEEEFDGCHWCSGPVEEDKEFCSKSCANSWINE